MSAASIEWATIQRQYMGNKVWLILILFSFALSLAKIAKG
jgi:hypothetical protein